MTAISCPDYGIPNHMLRPNLVGLHNVSVRHYRALAFESSCDDTCVALLEKRSPTGPVEILAQKKETVNSVTTGGIVPLRAFHFHQKNISRIVTELGNEAGFGPSSPPDLICATRGPGMVGSLTASLQFAKGLAYAWDRPLVGTHHMLGHLLTPKISGSANAIDEPNPLVPQYPYLSLLVSGGHTMLVLSSSVHSHEVLVDTIDIAAGDALDKCARALGLSGNMTGRLLEQLVEEIPPEKKQLFHLIAADGTSTQFPLKLSQPLKSAKHQRIPETVLFSFASFLSSISRYVQETEMTIAQRQYAAYKLQQILFEHIVDRISVAFEKDALESVRRLSRVRDFVCSGGVGANRALRKKLCAVRSPNPLQFYFPDIKLCTDNAAMIGNAGMEIFEQLRLKSNLGILPIQKWPMEDLLAVDGWEKVSDEEFKKVTGWTQNVDSIKS